VNPLQLDEVVQHIERSFGEELPVTGTGVSEADSKILGRLLHEDTFALYVQDQVNRQIIRDYLLNAVMLGCISEDNFELLATKVQSREERATLSLHMLMTAVEAANAIPQELGPSELKALRPEPGSPPHMVIVGS